MWTCREKPEPQISVIFNIIHNELEKRYKIWFGLWIPFSESEGTKGAQTVPD